jgi:hypothetical protein
LVAEGVTSHQWLHPPLHEAKGHMFGPVGGVTQKIRMVPLTQERESS